MMNFATDTCSGKIMLYCYYDGRKVSDYVLTLAEAKALHRILGETIEQLKDERLCNADTYLNVRDADTSAGTDHAKK